jgi:TonB-linked SusC/RagA family outer membrane protein
MQTLFVSLLLSLMICPWQAMAQTGKEKLVTIEFKEEGLSSIFKRLEKISGYKVSFIYDEVSGYTSTGKVENAPLEDALHAIIGRHPLKYQISGRFISITRVYPKGVIPKVKGNVLAEEDGLPVIGATVQVEGTNIRAITDLDGNFQLSNVPQSAEVKITYVGMQAVHLRAAAQLSTKMKSDTQALDEVVVQAGIIQRNKMGFTGSYTTVNSEDLKSVGNINVLQSLSALDPSFNIADNMSMGSDPNTMANITMRGGTTMNISGVYDDTTTNPNQPLFILDGFETTLQVVNDIDINRIESITLLKDAASTAIYGSKGANGVVVIETIKPTAGKVMINYNGNANVQWADLGGYNMMNAKEKLQYEVLAGRYGNLDDWAGNADNIAQYNSRLENIQRGVDTYWLKVPIRASVTQSHSLTISGGNKEGFLYQLGAIYKDVEGVMKGSSRKTFGGNVRLTYRKDKVNISNDLTVNVTNGGNGSWGSFSNFVNANPYYRMVNDDGTIPADLDTYQQQGSQRVTASNPYYNAMLDSQSNTNTLIVTNNTNINWYIIDHLRWTASMSLSGTNNDGFTFIDPSNTQFASVDYTKKGLYTSNVSRQWKYVLNTGLSYAVALKSGHNMTVNGRAEVESNQTKGKSWQVTGFPKGVGPIPSFAYSYKENTIPGYTEDVVRHVSFLSTFNYNYKYRYLFDASLSSDGSTAFGRDQKFQTFWSVGAGWNIFKEEFAKEWKWIDEWRLRGSYGSNGNQNVSNLTTNVYSYFSGSDAFGSGSYLSGYANPNLKWQVVKKASVGMDLLWLDKRLTVNVDYFHTNTNPLVVNLQQKPSSGLSTFPVNLGYLNTNGLEFTVSYYFIRDLKKRISLNARLNGITTKSRYGGFGQGLATLNSAYKKDDTVDADKNRNSLVSYQDGESPSALYAVRSLGIDPTTGREVFLTKNGTPTFSYNADDRVKIADSNPKLTGIFGLTFNYKQLIANVNLRYSVGGYGFNQALFNKVENITSNNIVYNQDKRALYDRWQKPGDVAQYKAISMTSSTSISSRFIQRNNYLRGESAKISWDFSRDSWLKSLFLQDLKVNVSFENFFDLSSMKQERGTDYPFQRAVSFGLSARF